MARAGTDWTNYARTPTEEARGEVFPNTAAEDLANEVTRREKQSNDQRETLFLVVLYVIGFMLVVDVTCVFLLGFGLIHLDAPVAVAFISAACVQSFGLVGILAAGLYARPKDDRNEAR